ncbi:hypothetical protein Ddc_15138 [Ditylenchus destructor]|nr:hypothetical protein Ddc_15138 [Ditylenchus destructor]
MRTSHEKSESLGREFQLLTCKIRSPQKKSIINKKLDYGKGVALGYHLAVLRKETQEAELRRPKKERREVFRASPLPPRTRPLSAQFIFIRTTAPGCRWLGWVAQSEVLLPKTGAALIRTVASEKEDVRWFGGILVGTQHRMSVDRKRRKWPFHQSYLLTVIDSKEEKCSERTVSPPIKDYRTMRKENSRTRQNNPRPGGNIRRINFKTNAIRTLLLLLQILFAFTGMTLAAPMFGRPPQDLGGW